jgi:hypothetical protein
MALISAKLMLSWKMTLEKWVEPPRMLGWKCCALDDYGELNRQHGFASPYAHLFISLTGS